MITARYMDDARDGFTVPSCAAQPCLPGIRLSESCPSSAVVCYRREKLPSNGNAYLFACNQGVLYAIVHSPLILLADISIALEGFDFPSKARGEVLALKILDLRNPTFSLQARVAMLGQSATTAC